VKDRKAKAQLIADHHIADLGMWIAENRILMELQSVGVLE
jgi:hypothetical protein